MAEDTGMKSAYELAMERLRKKDADAGIERPTISEAQKAAIAEIRSFYEAKLAQIDVMHQTRMRSLFDPAERQTAEDEHQRERERLTSDRDAKIEKARSS